MTQQPDPTIPFDASVVDEEALRALRAVQRTFPHGDGGASSNLVGGIATAAIIGTVQKGAAENFSLGELHSSATAASHTFAGQEEGLKPLEPLQSDRKPILLDPELPEQPAPTPSAISSSGALWKGARHQGSSDSVGHELPSASVTVVTREIVSDPTDRPVVTSPPVVRQPEELPDTTASPPVVAVQDARGDEDQSIALNLSAAVGDTDGSETLTIKILGIPEGAMLSHGHRERDGSWSVSAADLAHLTFTPPHDFSGDIKLTLHVTSHESNGGGIAIAESTFVVHVNPVADAPTVVVQDASGSEDAPVALSGLGGALRDRDGSESLSFILSGLPEGATLSAGKDLGGGRWELTEAQLSGLTLTPPENVSGTFTLTLTAVATEKAGGPSATTPATFTLTLDPVVDAGHVSGSATGNEDEWITLQPTFASPDQDGSEQWASTTTISGVPTGAVLNQGRQVSPGVWEVSTSELQAGHVAVKAPAHSDRDFDLQLEVTLSDTSHGVTSSRVVTGTQHVQVDAVADAPAVGAQAAEGREDQAIGLQLTAGLTDRDGSETLSVVIVGVPEGGKLSAGVRNADGSWSVEPQELAGLTLTPPSNFSGIINLTLQATSRETSNGTTATSKVPFQVHVDGEANAPHVDAFDVTGEEDKPVALNLSAVLTDTDGSEELTSVTITGLPPGATLSRGSRAADDSWVVSPADLPYLVLTPPPNYSGTLDLKVHVTSQESANGSTATTDAPFKVHVTAIADKPDVHAENATGVEDEAIPLRLDAKLTDTDDSEVLSVIIRNVPEGATFSHGTKGADGTWIVDPADLADLKFTPPKDFSGTINLTLEATSREISNGSVATSSTPFKVDVDAKADAPEITANGASGNEDTTIPLNLSTKAVDKDGSEEISSVIISGVPAGFELTHATRLSDGTWRVDPAELPDVAIIPPKNYSGNFNLAIETTSRETSNGSEATSKTTFPVHVEAVPDQPTVGAKDASGKEDTSIALDVSAGLTDTDDSEVLSVVIKGLPAGTRLSAGHRNSDGSWTLTPEQLSGLTMTPPANWSGTQTITVEAHSRETSNNLEATNTTTFQLKVDGVADAPSITIGNVSGDEDTGISLNLKVDLVDTDKSETLSVIISGIPDGAVLSHGTYIGNNSWSVDAADVSKVKLTPPHDFSGDIKLTVHATSHESNGDTALTEKSMTVHVTPVADAPTVVVQDASGSEDAPVALSGLGGALRDRDGSESLSFILSGLPEGATLSAGKDLGGGRWELTEAQLSGLTLTPPENVSGTFTLTLTAVATEKAGGPSATTPATFTLTLDPVVDAGSVSGAATGNEDEWIVLQPTFASPDQDGSEQWSSTTTISGVPTGAVLNQGRPVSPGVWEVSTAELQAGHVAVKAPADSDRDFDLQLEVTLSDTSHGVTSSRVVTGTQHVQVDAVADAPAVGAQAAEGREDQAIGLQLTAGLTDRDGSETLSVVIVGVPEGGKLSAGVRNADGSWSVEPQELAGLTLTPPKDFSGTIDLKIKATSHETSNGSEATSETEFHVKVDAVADAPGVRVSPAIGDEDTAIQLHVSAWTTDRDNSETITGFRIADVPEGAIVMAGDVVLERDAHGNVLVPPDVIDTLTITPPPQSDGDFTLKVYATSTEPNGDHIESAPVDLKVVVRAVADAPTILHPGASGSEDTAIRLNLEAATADTDGSETITFVISNIPPGAVLSEGTYRAPGVWSLTAAEAARVTITPAPDYSGTFELKITAISQEGNGGDQKVTTTTFPVHVGAVVDTPAVGGLNSDTGNWGTRNGNEDEPIKLNLDPGLSDHDGSEKVVGDIVISGVPDKAILKLADGTVVHPNSDGHYIILSSQMAGVTLTMPPNSDDKATLTIKMTVEDAGGVWATIGGHMVVDPYGKADVPKLELDPSSGTGHTSVESANGWIPLHIKAEVTDKDGSETLYMMVRGVPNGASLSDGSPVGDGVWLVPTSSLSSLSIRPKYGYSGSFDLRVTAIVVEDEGDQLALTKPVTVTVTAPDGGTGGDGGTGQAKAAQPPKLELSNAPTDEDHPVALSIKAELADGDNGKELLGIRIQGVPDGARLTVGIKDSETGDWLLRPSDLAKVEFVPPPDFSGTITLTVKAISQEATGSQAETKSTLDIIVKPVADAAEISASPDAGKEDHAVDLNLDVKLGDKDGSESITSIILSGPTGGATIAEGPGIKNNGDGTWTVDPAHLKDVQIIPPANSYGKFEVTVKVTTQEGANGHTTTATKTVAVSVAAEADAPTVVVHDATGKEDGSISLDLSAKLNDNDGSEVLSIVIEGLPAGARLTQGINNGDGTWTLTPGQLSSLSVIPPADWSGTMDLTMHAYARERSNGSVEETSATFHVQVDAVADAPLVSARNVSGDEDTDIPLSLSAILVDRDGSETLSVIISGIPDGALLSQGTYIGNNSWSVNASSLAGLKLTPPHDFSGRIELTMHVTATEKGGNTATSETPFVVQVGAVADAPTVVVQDASGSEDAPVTLTGLGGALRDRDGSESLSFILSGLPEGATLSAGKDLGGGRWELTEAQLSGLTLTPPENVSGTFTLTLTAKATEKAGGPSATTPATFTLTLDPVVDAGSVSGAATGQEDEWIVLQPTFASPDQDGSEQWSSTTTISGVPTGAVLNQGRPVSPGVWEVSTAELQAGHVAVKAPADSDRDFDLQLEVTLSDTSHGVTSSRVVTGTQHVQVDAVADAPAVGAQAAEGREDQAIGLQLTAGLTDRDGSETLSVVIVGVPEGGKLSAGVRNADGSWSVEPQELAGLTLTPPKDFSGTIDLTLHATAKETSTGQTNTSEAQFQVEVHGVADAPVVHAHDVSGQEDHAIALNLSAALSDTDGSEELTSVIISGVPSNFTLTHATMLEDGRWEVPAGSLSTVQLNPPQNWNGTLQLTLHATSVETASGSTVTASEPFTVTITPVNDAPELTLTAPSHWDAGAHAVSAVGGADAKDIDSTYLDGATITLSGARPGDQLDLNGYTLHTENGHVMIGTTGIELVGGGYNHATGSLTLSGQAAPGTYAEVLRALVLENSEEAGLTAGTRSIGITLHDSEGAYSVPKTVDVVVDEPVPPQAGLAHEASIAPPSDPMQDHFNSDMLLLMADSGPEATDTTSGSWTEQVDHSHQASVTHPTADLDQPVPDHTQSVNDFHVDIGRLNWS